MANVMRKPTQSDKSTNTQAMTCPECFSPDSFRIQDVEEAVTVGDNTALVRAQASVCQVCGYELLDVKNVEKIEAAYKRQYRWYGSSRDDLPSAVGKAIEHITEGGD